MPYLSNIWYKLLILSSLGGFVPNLTYAILSRKLVIYLFKYAMKGAGLRLLPLEEILICKWGPVERPVLPDIPTIVPAYTSSPCLTAITDRCP